MVIVLEEVLAKIRSSLFLSGPLINNFQIRHCMRNQSPERDYQLKEFYKKV